MGWMFGSASFLLSSLCVNVNFIFLPSEVENYSIVTALIHKRFVVVVVCLVGCLLLFG